MQYVVFACFVLASGALAAGGILYAHQQDEAAARAFKRKLTRNHSNSGKEVKHHAK